MSNAGNVSDPNPPQPVKPLDYQPRGIQIWSVGTLVYTLSGLTLLFTWLLWGDFALSLRERSLGKLTQLLFTDTGSSNTLQQILTATIPTTIGLFVGPAISYISDRHRSRTGRRIPFLIYLTPIAGLAMLGIAFSPQMGLALYKLAGHTVTPGLDEKELLQLSSSYVIGVFTVFWIIFEVAALASAPVFGGLINDVVPRSVLGRFHGMFRAISLYDGILFNAILLQIAERHFSLMFALIGIIFGGGFLLMCLKVKEGEYPEPEPEPDHFLIVPSIGNCMKGGAIVGLILGAYSCLVFTSFTVKKFADFTHPKQLLYYLVQLVAGMMIGIAVGALVGEAVARKGRGGFIWWFLAFIYRFFKIALGYVKECFAQPYYLLYFMMACITGLLFSPINSFSVRYGLQLGLELSDIGFIDAISYLCSLILAFPLGMMVDRFHPLRMSLAALGIYVLSTVYGCMYAYTAVPFAIALVAHTILSGTYFTCVASLAQQLLPRAKYSQYVSAGGIIGAIVNLIYQPLIGAALDVTKVSTVVNGKTVDHYNYHLLFWVTLAFLIISITLMLMVYRMFNRYGGVNGYVAPGDDASTIVRSDPPRHLIRVFSFYFPWAIVGLCVGYVLAYVTLMTLQKFGVYEFPNLRFTNIIPQMFEDKEIRNKTTFCLATGVLPFLVVGGWMGSNWAKKLSNKSNVIAR